MTGKAYKFRDWSKEFHKKLLTHRELFFASFDSLNDPNEGVRHLNYSELSKSELEEQLHDATRRYFPRYNDDFIAREVKGLKIRHDFSRPLTLPSEKTEKFDRNIGIFSLSRTIKNNLLWGHYAGGHKGFAVEFDLEAAEENMNYIHASEGLIITSEEVQYGDRPADVLMHGKIDGSEMLRAIITKTKDWGYEQEIRFVVMGATNIAVRFSPEAFKAIYLGSRIPEEHQDEILRIASQWETEIEVFESVFTLGSEEMTFVPVEIKA